jgi:hypothetical protein
MTHLPLVGIPRGTAFARYPNDSDRPKLAILRRGWERCNLKALTIALRAPGFTQMRLTLPIFLDAPRRALEWPLSQLPSSVAAGHDSALTDGTIQLRECCRRLIDAIAPSFMI